MFFINVESALMLAMNMVTCESENNDSKRHAVSQKTKWEKRNKCESITSGKHNLES